MLILVPALDTFFWSSYYSNTIIDYISAYIFIISLEIRPGETCLYNGLMVTY